MQAQVLGPVLMSPSVGGAALSPGWTFIQDQGWSCSPGSSSCAAPAQSGSGNFIIPTTAGSVWFISTFTGNTNITISSVTGGGGTWVVPAACHAFNSGHDDVMCAYNLTGTTGTTGFTVNYSGNTVTYDAVQFVELLPPAGYSASFDVAGSNSSGSCTVCNGASLTLTSTDAVVEAMDYDFAVAGASFHPWSSPLITDYQFAIDGIGLNVPSGSLTPTNTFTGNTAFSGTVAAAFKTSAGAFTTPAPVFSLVNTASNPAGNGITCNTTCTLTVPATGSGNLLILVAGDVGNNNAVLSSVTGGGTWVVPAGCQASATTSGTVSCAYVLSSTAAATTLNITMSANPGTTNMGFGYFEISRTSGSFLLDTVAAVTRVTGNYLPTGAGLTLTGTNDVIIHGYAASGGISDVQFYPQPYSTITNSFLVVGAAQSFAIGNSILFNTTNGTAPVLAYPADGNAVSDFGIAFK